MFIELENLLSAHFQMLVGPLGKQRWEEDNKKLFLITHYLVVLRQ
jgi:hypothetical protein